MKKGSKHTEETKNKIGEANKLALKGKKLSEEHKRNIGIGNKNQSKETITNRIETRKRNNKIWHSEETKRKIGLANKGRKNPPNVGFKKGQKFTEEHKRKLSLAKIGRKYSKEHRKNMSKASNPNNKGRLKKGHKPWNKGKKYCLGIKHSKESKEKLSKTRKRLIKEGKIKIPSRKEHYNWQGGKSFEPYGLEFNKELREKIKQRDNFTCQLCNDRITESRRIKNNPSKKWLTVHHIDYNKQNNKPENLLTLCHFCNISVNSSREEWTKHFQNINLKRGIT